MKYLKILHKIPLFYALTADEKQAVADLQLRLFRYPAKTMVIRKGDQDDDLFFLVKGTVTVVGEGALPKAILNTGEVFGEVGFLSGQQTRTANVITNNEVIVMRMDREKFLILQPALREKIKDQLIPILIEHLLGDEMDRVLALSTTFDSMPVSK